MFHTQGFYFLFICVSSLCFFLGGGGVPRCHLPAQKRSTMYGTPKITFHLNPVFFISYNFHRLFSSTQLMCDYRYTDWSEKRVPNSVLLWFNHQRTGRFNTVPEVYMYFIKCICCWKEMVLSLNTLDEMLCPWQSTEKCFLWCFPIMSDSQALQESCYTVHKALKCLKFGYR